MHDFLARLYHLGLHVLMIPGWRGPVAALVVAAAARLMAPRRAAIGASVALLAGWLALVWPGPLSLASPVARLPGLAVLLLAYVVSGGRLGRAALPLCALIAAWWLRGAPLNGAGLASIMPVFLGVLAAMAITRRMAAADRGWAGLGAALALAAAIPLAGGAMHWARAALVAAAAGAAFIGLADAVALLQIALVLVAAAAVVASDRGRLIPIDAAACTPLLVWFLAPRLLPRLNRAGPALAGALAAVAGVGIVWAAIYLFAQR
jgi:hypothetical protein